MYNRIDLTLRPGILAGLLAALPWILMTVAVVALAATGPALMAPVAVFPALMGLRQFRRSGLLQGPSSVHRLTLQAGELRVLLGDGRQVAARVTGDSRVFARLALLKLRTQATTVNPSLVVLHDRIGPAAANADPDEFRRLRVWLRLTKAPGPTSRSPSWLNHGESRNG